MIAVVGTLIVMSLLMVTALQLVQDHRRRATLAADHALALQEAETALAAAECGLALATGTPIHNDCRATPDDARIAALNPITLAGFVSGRCGQNAELGLCWPTPGQSVRALAKLLDDDTNSVVLPIVTQRNGRSPALGARYVIEPIPDALPGQWVQAGAARGPSLFRITAAGFGGDKQVNVMLQTVYRPKGIKP
nr:pilus assembly protein PilZ [uncultured Ralstonia sp.]